LVAGADGLELQELIRDEPDLDYASHAFLADVLVVVGLGLMRLFKSDNEA
jgi:hypothetical protein